MPHSAGPSVRLELRTLSKEDDMMFLEYIAQKYPPAELLKMIEEAMSIRSGAPSRLSYSSQLSNGDVRWSQCSMLTVDSASSFELTYSNPSSSFCHVGTPVAPNVATTTLPTPTVIPATPATLPKDQIAQTKKFPCPFCAQEGIINGAGKSGDFIRHLRIHRTDAQWSCNVNDCGLVFDFGTAYELHMKAAHPGTQLPESAVKLELLPQFVFGCGHRGCTKVFVATKESDIPKFAELYFKHIKDHVKEANKEGTGELVWDYSTQIRNLLRQNLIHDEWQQKTEALPKHRFVWHRHNSNILMKMLQCGVIANIPEFISIAATLGSGPFCQPTSHQIEATNFSLPTKDNMIAGHDSFSMKPESLYRLSGNSETSGLPFQALRPKTPDDTYMNQIPALDFPTSFPNTSGLVQVSSAHMLMYDSANFGSLDHSFTHTTSPDHNMYTSGQPIPQLQSQYFMHNIPDSEPALYDKVMKELPQIPTRQSQSQTPGQRITGLARKSIEGLRGRKSMGSLRGRKSSVSQADIDMEEAVPPLPKTSLPQKGSRDVS